MAGKIAYNPILPDSTVTMSSEAVTYGKERLFDNSPQNKARTTGISSESILVNYGSAVNIKAVYFENSNIVSGDTTCTIQAGATSAATDYGPTAMTKAAKSFLEIDQTYQYWKHIATKASGTYIEWGKFELFQEYDEFTKNYQYERSTGKRNVFRERTGPTGVIVNEFLYSAKVFTWTFLDVAQAQVDLFYDTYGTLNSCLIYDDYENTHYYGIIKLSIPRGNRTGKYDFTLNFTEKK
jgi:hypothetical protein